MPFETTMKMRPSVLVAREIYKCLFENTMIFSNYLLAVNLMLSLFYFHKLRMQVPISRNTLKYLTSIYLDKLKHYITCKSYTKVLTF